MNIDNSDESRGAGPAVRRALASAIIGSLFFTSVSASAQRRTSPDYDQQQADAEASRAIAEREAAAKEAAPWHYETSPYYRFGDASPGGNLASERHFRSAFSWTSMSNKMADKGGMFPDYVLYLGIMANGRHGGAIYGDPVTAIVGESAAAAQLMKIGSFAVFAEDGEVVEIPLGPVESAKLPGFPDRTVVGNVYFRQFQLPEKAYRMMGALPEKNRLRYLFTDSANKQGAFSYHSQYQKSNPWAYSIGYAKELSRLAQESGSK
ncbi:MAG: hypothetical protein WAT93_12210 [Pontixanthobacter sp.]